MSRCTLVLDVGKTNVKMTLWGEAGHCLARQVHANATVQGAAYPALDAAGIEAWIKRTLKEFAALGSIATIIPVTHGAAAALVKDGSLFTPPMDYEAEIPAEIRTRYASARDDFSLTGSPFLPQGLNLGTQLAWLEELTGPWPDDAKILLWPQYWAWRFSGVMASEVTSLGCHSDLWRPIERRPTELAVSRGWADRLPPLRAAGDILGPVTAEWVEECGLHADCQIRCGLHDSNAALVAARGHPQIDQNDATIVSTGTWFIAMRSLGSDGADLPTLSETRDCLINVDVKGRPAPSARFMGGRESELIAGLDIFHITKNYDPEAVVGTIPDLIARNVMVLPTHAPGFGPFPDLTGRWINEPNDTAERRAALGLYLALMADVTLDLVGCKQTVLVEGRFAEAEAFIRSLATLRKDASVFISNAQDDVPFGALRLVWPDLRPTSELKRVAPLPFSLDAYRAAWQQRLLTAGAQRASEDGPA